MSYLLQFANKKVLITGGLGFIGSTLAIKLADLGAEVTVLDSLIPEYGGNRFNIHGYEQQITVNVSDVRDQYGMNHLIRNKDYLFNLAGQTSHVDSMNDPFTDLEINCRSQLSILESCRKYNPDIRVVFASTRQMYGKPQYLPVDEDHPLVPVDVNGINKLAGEMYHRLFSSVYGIQTCALRLTNTYGPRMRVKDARQTFLGIWIKNILEGQPIQVFGDGLQLRDFNYIDDVVEALLLAALCDGAQGQVFNLGSPEVISLKDLAELLVKVNGDGTYQIVPFPPERKIIDIGDYYGDFERFRHTTGWQPNTELDTGLTRTLSYFRRYAEFYWEVCHARSA